MCQKLLATRNAHERRCEQPQQVRPAGAGRRQKRWSTRWDEIRVSFFDSFLGDAAFWFSTGFSGVAWFQKETYKKTSGQLFVVLSGIVSSSFPLFLFCGSSRVVENDAKTSTWFSRSTRMVNNYSALWIKGCIVLHLYCFVLHYITLRDIIAYVSLMLMCFNVMFKASSRNVYSYSLRQGGRIKLRPLDGKGGRRSGTLRFGFLCSNR